VHELAPLDDAGRAVPTIPLTIDSIVTRLPARPPRDAAAGPADIDWIGR
jgi:hypothetical protein